MSARKLYDLLTMKNGRIRFAGSWQGNGASAPSNVEGKGFTVARSAQGEYTITFNDKFVQLDAVNAEVRHGTGTPFRIAQAGPYDGSAGTLVIRVIDNAGAAQDITSQHCNFSCVLSNNRVA